MATYLLTWNPSRWGWDALADTAAEVSRAGRVSGRWSCGRTRRIVEGDRLFLLKQGRKDPGLLASAWAASDSYPDEHWDEAEPADHDALYVDLDWDVLATEPVIGREELLARYPSVHWNTQMSGIAIEAEAARALEREWGRRVGSYFEPLADEVLAPTYTEGAARLVAVNAYERSGAARAACIAHYGRRCAVCDVDFGERYGPDAAGLIHVHHLTPLAQVGAAYKVDPIRDLRPVCPNCHAVLHLVDPPLTIEAAARLLAASGRQPAGSGSPAA